MAWPKRIVCVRHAESEGNVRTVDERAGLETPTHGYALTERGRKQAQITAEYLKESYDGFDIRYVSYYRRARETLQILAPEQKFYEDPRLREGERGFRHSMTKAEIEERYPDEERRKLRDGLYHYRPFGGENWADIELRIHSFLGTLNRDAEGKTVLMVVHGQWLIAFQRLIEHFSIDEAIQRFKDKVFENASVTEYESLNGKRFKKVKENHVPWKGRL